LFGYNDLQLFEIFGKIFMVNEPNLAQQDSCLSHTDSDTIPFKFQPMRILIHFIIMLMIAGATYAQSPEQKLKDRNILLPSVSASLGNYIDLVQVGNLLFLSGKGPLTSGGNYIEGKLGGDLTIEEGYTAARVSAVNQLAVLKSYIGDLRRIKRIVKVNGFVNCVNSFVDHPKVINGFSDLMVEIFGKSGKHTRTAVGTNSLPHNMAVEVEMIVEIGD